MGNATIGPYLRAAPVQELDGVSPDGAHRAHHVRTPRPGNLGERHRAHAVTLSPGRGRLCGTAAPRVRVEGDRPGHRQAHRLPDHHAQRCRDANADALPGVATSTSSSASCPWKVTSRTTAAATPSSTRRSCSGRTRATPAPPAEPARTATGPSAVCAVPSVTRAASSTESPTNRAVSRSAGLAYRSSGDPVCTTRPARITRHEVGGGQGLLLVVGHQHRCRARRPQHLADLGPQLRAHAGVQGGERFVEQDDLGARAPAPWRGRPAAAARPTARGASGRPSPTRPTSSSSSPTRPRSLDSRRSPNPMLRATDRCGNSAPSCGTSPSRRFSGATQAPGPVRATPPTVDGAGLRALEPGHHPQQRRLPASGGPEHGEQPTLRDVEVGAVESDDGSEPLADATEDQPAHPLSSNRSVARARRNAGTAASSTSVTA